MLPWTFTCNFTATWKTQISHIKWFTESWWLHPSIPVSSLSACCFCLQHGTRLNNWTANRRFTKRLAARALQGPNAQQKPPETVRESKKLIHIYCLITSLYAGGGKELNASIQVRMWRWSKVFKSKAMVALVQGSIFFPLLAKNCSFDANSGPLLCRWRKPQKQS